VLEGAGRPVTTGGRRGGARHRRQVLFADGDEMTFLLGSREVASGELDVYSEQSPLGSAINGKKIGEAATYALPNGRKLTVRSSRRKLSRLTPDP
jgi:hypothetical protein